MKQILIAMMLFTLQIPFSLNVHAEDVEQPLKSTWIDQNTEFSVEPYDFSELPVETVFHLTKRGTCEELREEAKSVSYDMDFGDAAFAQMLPQNEGEPHTTIESNVCELVWEGGHSYSAWGTFEAKLLKNNGFVTAITIVLDPPKEDTA